MPTLRKNKKNDVHFEAFPSFLFKENETEIPDSEVQRPLLKFEVLMGRSKRIWYLSPMRAAKVQASLRIRAVSPEPSLLAHTSSESRGTFRQTARSLAPLNGWTCAVKICHDGRLEDTNSLDGALIKRMHVTVYVHVYAL